jgi:hypothetical protein
LDSVRRRVAHVLESLRPEIRVRGQSSTQSKKFSSRFSSRNHTEMRKGFARSKERTVAEIGWHRREGVF